VFRRAGRPVLIPPTLPELYEKLRGLEAIAIPHHTGYHPAIRAPRWAACDERLSPFAELFSCHGCSETDEEWIGLRRNSHMGPGLGGGTYQDALNAGLHLGAIGSTDNWSHTPGCWGNGLMACLAADLTRDSLWDAFQNRRVYGVTGDRIELDFTCNGAAMGSILPPSARREIRVQVRAADALDRIELLRNGQVIETHCHQGAWDAPADNATTRFKLRLESGWGPRPGELPFGERRWTGVAELSRGTFTGWQPCWISPGQERPRLEGRRASWSLLSRQIHVQTPFQGGLILKFECDPAAEFRLVLNGLEARWPVRDLVRASRVLWHRAESIAMLRDLTVADPDTLDRTDPIFYQFAFKTKVHRAVPESGFTAALDLTDTTPLRAETHYRVRVEQRNGQRAWSSPIWVQPG
jgi:hypothetical protein